MANNVAAALKLVSQLQADLAQVRETARLAAQAAADTEANCRALIERLTQERDRLLEQLEHGKP
jgi:hypothetical protein